MIRRYLKVLNNLCRRGIAISELLEAPKAILNAGPWVVGAPDANHQEGHEGEEEGDDEAKPIDCLVSNNHCTVHLGFESYDCYLKCALCMCMNCLITPEQIFL